MALMLLAVCSYAEYSIGEVVLPADNISWTVQGPAPLLQGYWTNEFSPSAGGAYADKSYWLCTENWDGQNYPIDTNAYDQQGGFSNGYSPLFVVIGFNNVVYYCDNYRASVEQAVRDAIDSFPTEGVYVENLTQNKNYLLSEVDAFDISNVFEDVEGDDVTITLESNTDPSIATVSLVGTTLTITASGVNVGETTITLKGEDVTNVQSATDVFIVKVKDPFQNLALDFDGVDEVVSVIGFNGIAGTTARTVEAWIKASPSITLHATIIKWGVEVNGQRWSLRVDGNTGGLRTEVWMGNIIGATDLRDDQWHHVAVTWENDGTPNITDAKLYVDGVLETIASSVDEPINTSIETSVRIGGESGVGFFDGCIDELRVWNIARTETEISNNKFTLADPESEANLVTYYRFDETSGSVLPAIIGGHDGSLSNMEDVDWVEVDYYLVSVQKLYNFLIYY